MVRWLAVLVLGALACGCTPEDCPYGSMLESDGGLLVTDEEHPTGWGQEECAQCHAFPQLHRQGCTPGIDLEAVRQVVDADGGESCMGCHGENGTGGE